MLSPACIADPIHVPSSIFYSFCTAGELLEIVRGGELASAVDACLCAAASELDPLKQAALLKAAAYGRAFTALQPGGDGGGSGGIGGGGVVLPGVDSRRQMVEVARRLRVLNAIRQPGGCVG